MTGAVILTQLHVYTRLHMIR